MERAAHGRWWLGLCVVVMLGFAALASRYLIRAADSIETGERVVVVFPPSYSREQALHAIVDAGGYAIEEAALPSIVISVANSHGYGYDLQKKHKVLLLDPLVSGGCNPVTVREGIGWKSRSSMQR